MMMITLMVVVVVRSKHKGHVTVFSINPVFFLIQVAAVKVSAPKVSAPKVKAAAPRVSGCR